MKSKSASKPSGQELKVSATIPVSEEDSKEMNDHFEKIKHEDEGEIKSFLSLMTTEQLKQLLSSNEPNFYSALIKVFGASEKISNLLFVDSNALKTEVTSQQISKFKEKFVSTTVKAIR